MFCKCCGKEISDDSIFCSYCGKNVFDRPAEEIEDETRATISIPVKINHLRKTIQVTASPEMSTKDLKMIIFLGIDSAMVLVNPEICMDFESARVIMEKSGENILDYECVGDLNLGKDDVLLFVA